MKSEFDAAAFAHHEHGTRAKYVSGCRCADCTKANLDRYHDRQQRMEELASDLTPNGPPGSGFITRGGTRVRVATCPGAEGLACVKGGAWLKNGAPICKACVERHTVWDGFVDPERARAHLLRLRRMGVGKRAVSDASDVPTSILDLIVRQKKRRIRASTERSILSVDRGALADGALVTAKKSLRQIAKMTEAGFTGRHLAQLLGQKTNAPTIGPRMVSVRNQAKVQRIYDKWRAGLITPARDVVEAKDERKWLDSMLSAGVTASHLTKLVGFTVERTRRTRMRRSNRDAIRRAREEIEDRYGVGPGGIRSYAEEQKWLRKRERRLRRKRKR